MLDYMAGLDIRAVLESRFEIPDDLDAAEVGRWAAAAATAMAPYDLRLKHIPVRWEWFGR